MSMVLCVSIQVIECLALASRQINNVKLYGYDL